MRKKVATTVYFDPGPFRDLKALAAKRRVPWAVVLREALDAYLHEHRREIPPPAPDPRQLPLPS